MPEIRRIAEAVETLEGAGTRSALATIVEAEGSAYRREGARLLISERGSTVGAVSGGCLDADLFERAKHVIETGSGEVVAYDSEDAFDLVFGTGLGCGGRLLVLIEPVTSRLTKTLQLAKPSKRPDLIAEVKWKGDDRGTRFMSAKEAMERGIHIPEGDKVVRKEGELVQRISPPLRIVVFGAGPAAATLCNLASDLDWVVEVADHREVSRSSGAFDRADRIVVAPVEQQVSLTKPDANTATVVMTHNVLRDLEIVRQLIESDTFYLGILGPKKRSAKLLDDLRRDGIEITAERVRHLFGPTGLSIGSESPSEIALAILAEIQAVRSGVEPVHLRDRTGPIHRRRGRGPVLAAVLAAGSSSRLGYPKQRVSVGSETLLRLAVSTALGSGCEEAIVVLGADERELVPEVKDLPIDVVVNQAWQEGIASSIRAAVREAEERNVEGLLLMLCDQPGVTQEVSGRITERFRTSDADVIACEYTEGGGVPAVFASTTFERLRSLEGDHGARNLIRGGELKVDVLPIDPGPDVDSPEDVGRIAGACGLPDED